MARTGISVLTFNGGLGSFPANPFRNCVPMHHSGTLRGTPASLQKELLHPLPDTVGVYLFYGEAGELLYVGKSRHIRARVRAHFAAPEEVRMCRLVRRVEVRETAGELGALLLELQLIKELRPMYNIRSRQHRRIIVARRVETRDGYASIVLEAVDRIEASHTSPLMAIFRSNRQAKEYLGSIAHTHRLCLKLLGLERTSRSCFGHHLGYCAGACIGLEQPAAYNARVDTAFAERRVRAWPFDGAILIQERTDNGQEGEVFLVDNWCLLYSFVYSENRYRLRVRGPHRFDYDSYRILAGYVFNQANHENIRPLGPAEYEALMKAGQAA